jgi:hypothetical protein
MEDHNISAFNSLPLHDKCMLLNGSIAIFSVDNRLQTTDLFEIGGRFVLCTVFKDNLNTYITMLDYNQLASFCDVAIDLNRLMS